MWGPPPSPDDTADDDDATEALIEQRATRLREDVAQLVAALEPQG